MAHTPTLRELIPWLQQAQRQNLAEDGEAPPLPVGQVRWTRRRFVKSVGYMDAYLSAAGIGEDKGTPLFRTALGKTGQLTDARMSQPAAWRMLQRRAKKAGVTTAICNYSWRATGITVFLENGGAIEMAQYMAGHADPRTTKLYDRRRQQVTRSEVERIRYQKMQAKPAADPGS